MFDICMIGENVVEERKIVEERLTKLLRKYIKLGARTCYFAGDLSFSPIALNVNYLERRKNVKWRYYNKTIYDDEGKEKNYKKIIDTCEIVILYLKPFEEDVENLILHYARLKKRRIINIYKGEKHFLLGTDLEHIDFEINLWKDYLKK